jgi:NAD(P)-dependent dehydrogenase (short-subunit alcohol dehydrogenase family)
MAGNSLPQSTLDTFQPISATVVHALARMAARRAVQEQLRSQGVRVSLVKPAEISARAQRYLAEHPELYKEALERAQRLGLFEKKRKLRAPMITPDRSV